MLLYKDDSGSSRALPGESSRLAIVEILKYSDFDGSIATEDV